MTDSALSPADAFSRLGQITRQLHEAMSELGFHHSLQQIAQDIPDARDRLSYVGKMTENAAHKVLGLVEQATPDCQALAETARATADRLASWEASPDLSPEPVQALVAQSWGLADAALGFADRQQQTLNDIMMAQDFQDLSGQVIKKVIDIISQTEQQLVQLLMNTAPVDRSASAASDQLQGPQVPDKALKQDDVDDLLASLGF